MDVPLRLPNGDVARTPGLKTLQRLIDRFLREGIFHHISDVWQRRWAKCVALNGEYVEGVVVNTE